ncbi:alpha-L-rhamnosidase-related protein [Algibacillus agarilyticus]|uniref:alpha-L-rhamnosidase-related protein n=1 Tax=Algibacillus agarilyticus TaxID=2234133 RepID=UPI00130018A7|nr:esterase [Algibacillus agarilyticus]
MPSSVSSLYLRGAFNGWGVDHPFKKKEKSIYTATIEVTPGNFGFKVATEDWSSEWVVNVQSQEIITLGTRYFLHKTKAPEDALFVNKTGRFVFTLDLTQPDKPILMVNQAIEPTKIVINPHENQDEITERKYETYDHKFETVTYSIADSKSPLRAYTQSSTAELRDAGPKYTKYTEKPDLPYIRTGSVEFDALFALAINEMGYLSVDSINDGNYKKGQDIACQCFKTGEKWAYVWTRDLAYAADLSLALLDPERVLNSLLFKTSFFRDNLNLSQHIAGDLKGRQIIQDTGSGGSWPVSTDRVTWAFGADKVLDNLPQHKRQAFLITAFDALVNTIENDRIVAFDKHDGLYRGEQSFLDWREQTYATWIVNDLSQMATSKALSTNAAHYKALTLAAKIAKELNRTEVEIKYSDWASQLKKAINNRLWIEETGLYSSLTAGEYDSRPLKKYDWLGQSLAIITGIASNEQAASILSHYPHGPMGAPVIFPQQPEIAVYHNRAIWPFVTAYGLKAATSSQHTSAADAAYKTLIRGAALNLSNMENLEWLSGQPMWLQMDAPSMSGPVINSKYQLWSVAAYLNMVVENVFGIKTDDGVLSINPFISPDLLNDHLQNRTELSLKNLSLLGKKVNITLNRPLGKLSQYSYLTTDHIKLNGVMIEEGKGIPLAALAANNHIVVQLKTIKVPNNTINLVKAKPGELTTHLFAPLEPELKLSKSQNNQTVKKQVVRLVLKPHPKQTFKQSIAFNLYRNGKLLQQHVKAGEHDVVYQANEANCYIAEAINQSSLYSHPSRNRCVGSNQFISVESQQVKSNVRLDKLSNGMSVIKDWGKEGDQLKISQINIEQQNKFSFRFAYDNKQHVIGQGITAGVKWLEIINEVGHVVAQGVIQFPHVSPTNAIERLTFSTALQVELVKGVYQVELTDFFNMSYLQSNETYSASGGLSGAVNQVDLYGLQISHAF